MGMFGPNGGSRSGAAKPSLVAALDVGTSKIECLIAEAQPRPHIEVVGVGRRPSEGVKAGAIVDLDAAERAIRGAVEQAERMAGAAVSQLIVGYSGGQMASRRVTATTALAPERPVSDRDMRRALDAALSRAKQPGRSVIHAFPASWSVDDHSGVLDPRGMFGAELGVTMLTVNAQECPIVNLRMCVERAQMQLKSIVAAPYASGLAALAPDEIALGATVIDMGAGVTSAAVFLDGGLAHLDVVRLGGGHVTNDLALGLSAPYEAAERIKRYDGAAVSEAGDDRHMIAVPQMGDEEAVIRVPRSELVRIIRPRLEETFEMLRDKLDAADALHTAGKRLVLTGGAAQIPGVVGLAGQILGKRARIASSRGVIGPDGEIIDPSVSTAAGVLRHAIQGPRDAIDGPPRRGPARIAHVAAGAGRSGLARAADWLRECF